jgi:hypothetical protein
MDDQKVMEWRLDKIKQMEEKLEKTKNGRRREKLIEKIEMQKSLIDDPELADKMHREAVDSSAFTKIGNAAEKTGDKIQSAGKGMVKAGLHTTGAVWTPLIYLGYQGVKHARKKPKNASVEQDLIELIQEVEKAEKDGKITEEQKRGYIIDFVDNYYKK